MMEKPITIPNPIRIASHLRFFSFLFLLLVFTFSQFSLFFCCSRVKFHYKQQQIEFNCKYGAGPSEDQISHQTSLFVHFSEFCLWLLNSQKLQKTSKQKNGLFKLMTFDSRTIIVIVIIICYALDLRHSFLLTYLKSRYYNQHYFENRTRRINTRTVVVCMYVLKPNFFNIILPLFSHHLHSFVLLSKACTRG